MNKFDALLTECQNLLPDSVLCGHDDYLPGVENHSLPKNPNEMDINPLGDKYTISIDHIKINIGQSLDRSILENVYKFHKQKYEKLKQSHCIIK